MENKNTLYIGRFEKGYYFISETKLKKNKFEIYNYSQPTYTIMDFDSSNDKVHIIYESDFERIFPNIHLEKGEMIEFEAKI